MEKNRCVAMRERLLRAINYCNTQIINPSEYYVISALFKHVRDTIKNSLLLESLANESAASQASISRFIKKIGYPSYQDFRNTFLRSLDDLWFLRKNRVAMNYDNVDEVIERNYACAIDNLKQTYSCLDRESLERIVRRLLSSRSVTIIGDDHVLSIFYTVQLDLLANGIPAYLFKNEEMQMLHVESLGEKDVLLFLTVSMNFIRPEQCKMIEDLQHKATLMGFFQENDDAYRKMFDEYYVYGRENTAIEGFYSLLLLSRLISEMLYIVNS